MKQLPVTHQQIADKLGISRSAVTLALHRTHGARISEEMRAEILQAARELDYQPRNLTTHTVAIVVNAQGLQWGQADNFLLHADQTLRQHGFRMAVVVTDSADIAAGKKLISPKTADGAIFTEWHGGKVRRLVTPDLPWILNADEDGDLGCDVDQVAMNTVETTANLTRYLIERGHKRICLMTGEMHVGFHERMQRGMYRALGEAGLPLDNASFIATNDSKRERVEISRKILGALQKKNAPTAVITGGLGGVMVMLNQLQRVGCKIPEDMSLVSITDSLHFEAFQPAITATDVLGRRIASQAVERLIKRIKQPEIARERVLVPGQIIERESVRRIKNYQTAGNRKLK